MRRKLKEEKEQIDEAPIVPVLRPQKIEESPGKDSKLKLEYLSPIWAYLRPIKHTWAHMSPWEPNLRPFELIWELLSPFEHIWAWFEPTWAQLNLETRISKSNFQTTVWKFHDFPITQILREINFEDSSSAKFAILTHLEALNCDFYKVLHFLKAQIDQKI